MVSGQVFNVFAMCFGCGLGGCSGSGGCDGCGFGSTLFQQAGNRSGGRYSRTRKCTGHRGTQRYFHTASGWRRSIMWSMRERKKSSVAEQAKITRNSQKSASIEYQTASSEHRQSPQKPVFMRIPGVLQERPIPWPRPAKQPAAAGRPAAPARCRPPARAGRAAARAPSAETSPGCAAPARA